MDNLASCLSVTETDQTREYQFRISSVSNFSPHDGFGTDTYCLIFLTSMKEMTNLYGAHPFYLAMEEGGDAHGFFLLNSNAMGDYAFYKDSVLCTFSWWYWTFCVSRQMSRAHCDKSQTR